MKIKAVIFDMDGIILDTETLLSKYWRRAAEEFGFHMTYEQSLELRSLAGEYAAPLLKKYFGEGFDYAVVRARRKELMEKDIAENGLKKKKGIDEALDKIEKLGLRKALATPSFASALWQSTENPPRIFTFWRRKNWVCLLRSARRWRIRRTG